MDTRYLKGIEHFNKREFFEAHEVWEDLWNDEHGREKLFVQGLIQFATSLHHFEAKNLKGTKILYDSGVELLTPFGDVFWSMPVKKLITDMTECVKNIFPYNQSELPGRYHSNKDTFPVQIDDALVPKIHLSEPHSHD